MRRAVALLFVALALACGRRAPEVPDPADLAQHVTIRRDTYGIPHILADSEEAAAFGFGYAQAEDHGEEIGRRYISARGELAKYFGEGGMTGDFAMAQFDNVEQSRRGLEKITPLYRRIISAYAAGVNRYVATHRDKLPAWMPTITAADVLAATRASAADSLAGEALIRRLREKYEPGKLPPEGGSHTFKESRGFRLQAEKYESFKENRGFRLQAEEYESLELPGSNALALSGQKTTTGKPILLGNPHLQWASLYWEAHVRVPGVIDFYGSTLPGIPVLRAGFNDRLGFVTTNNAPDLDDVLTLTLDPNAPDHYLFDGTSMPLTRRDAAIQVRNADGSLRTERRTFWSSHLGVVIHRTADRAFAVTSTRLDAFEYYGGFYVLSKARTLKDWMAALRQNHVPTSNFTYADADGNVLYVWNGRVPVRREGGDYRLDTEVSTTADLWPRLHDLDDYPRLLNPPGGYVQNANNPPRFVSARDPIDMSRYPSYFERGPLALRPQLALEMLEAKDKFSVQDVIDLKYSTRLLLADRVKADVVAAVRNAADASAEARAGADVLDAWDNTASAASRGALLFQRFWDLYSGAVRSPYAVAWDEANPATTPRGISDPAAAVTHLGAAVRAVRVEFGSESVAWGDVHRFRAGDLDLPADGAGGAYGAYRVMTFQPAGGRRVAGHVAGRPGPVGFGDAWILLVDFSKPGTAWSVLAYGQTTNPDSPHSRDQLELFASHRLRPALYAEADVKAHAIRTYRP